MLVSVVALRPPLFTIVDTVVILYCNLMRCKLKFASAAWNSVALTDSSEVESVQRKFPGLCYNELFYKFCTNKYDNISLRLNLSKLLSSKGQLDVLFPY
jgi:hypothetical protein